MASSSTISIGRGEATTRRQPPGVLRHRPAAGLAGHGRVLVEERTDRLGGIGERGVVRVDQGLGDDRGRGWADGRSCCKVAMARWIW